MKRIAIGIIALFTLSSCDGNSEFYAPGCVADDCRDMYLLLRDMPDGTTAAFQTASDYILINSIHQYCKLDTVIIRPFIIHDKDIDEPHTAVICEISKRSPLPMSWPTFDVGSPQYNSFEIWEEKFLKSTGAPGASGKDE